MCGGSTPEPPPDYTRQKRHIQSQVESDYQNQADTWNSQVSDFNDSLLGSSGGGGLLSSLQDFQRDHRNLGVADISIESGSADHSYDDLRGALDDFQSSLSDLHAPSSRPRFDTTVGSGYGPVGITNIPTLNDPNVRAFDQAQSLFANLDQNLSRLRDERLAERERIDDYAANLSNTISGQLGAARDFDLSQASALDSMQRDRDQVHNRIQGFRSPILDQVGGDSFGGAQDLLAQLDDQIQSNIGMRDAEQQRIDDFRGDLMDMGGQMRDRLRGATIRDENVLNSLDRDMGRAFDQVRDFDSDLDFDFSRILGQSHLGGLRADLDDLMQQRESELDRTSGMRRDIQGFNREVDDRIGQLRREIGSLGLGDEHRIRDIEREIDSLMSQKRSFAGRDWSSDLYDSSLFDEYFRPPGDTSIRDTAGALRGELDGVRQMHDDERDRISGFGSSLFDTASDLRSQVRDLGIADIDDIEGVRQAIENQMMDINRFESPLDFNFGRQMNEIMDVDNIASDLIRDRGRELDRISRAEDNFSRTGRMLRDRTGDLGIHNRANLESARDALGDITSDIEGFESELDFDFSDVYDDLLPSIQSDLDELFAERRGALDGISESGNQAVDGLDDLALYDEDGMLGMRSDVFDAKRDLNRFSGGSVEDIRENLRGNIERVDGRLEELQEKRNQLTEQTEKLRTRLADKSFYTSEGLEPHEAELQAMRDEADLYNAQQAMSDLQHAEDRLGQERVRLEQDEQNAMARRNQEQSDVAGTIGPDGVPIFQDFGNTDPYSMSAYQRFLRSGDSDDMLYSGGQPSGSFARNLGLGG